MTTSPAPSTPAASTPAPSTPASSTPAPSTRVSHAGRLLVRLVLGLVVLAGSCLVAAPGAEALTAHQRDRVLHVAASKRGTPYRYGASGPRAFDCSGYTRWVFRRVGKTLPRTSRAQRRATRRIAADHRRRGDLVFFSRHGRVYHVAIYAGRNRIWHAPRTGQRVHRERLWTRRVTYGRVR